MMFRKLLILLLIGLVGLGLMAALWVGMEGVEAQSAGPPNEAQYAPVSMAALGTAITYQGELAAGGGLVNGRYDFEFRLYDGEVGGLQVGDIVTVKNHLVTDGRFTVLLDFGDVYDGTPYWLEIGVRPTGSGSDFTVLTPRQALTPAPYALYAANVPQHDHLDQTWVGSGNSLVITGAFDIGEEAALSLGNTAGHGLRVGETAGTGVYIDSSGDDGLRVNHADGFGLRVVSSTLNAVQIDAAELFGLRVMSSGGDGLHVGTAGGFGLSVDEAKEDGAHVASSGGNGFRVSKAGYDGLRVEEADLFGVRVLTATQTGVYVGSAGGHGLRVGSAKHDGLWINEAGLFGVRVVTATQEGVYVGRADVNGFRVDSAGQDGIRVNDASGYAGYFSGTIYAESCTGCTITAFGINTGQQTLESGDILAVVGAESSQMPGAPLLLDVRAAQAGEGVVGVVQGRADLKPYDDVLAAESHMRLVPGIGPVAPGDYVTIIIYGLAQVKADSSAGATNPGSRLVVGETGRARSLRTAEVDGLKVAESAPTLGIALEEADVDGLIWVLVNPQ